MKKILLASALVLSFVSSAPSAHASASEIFNKALDMMKNKSSSASLCEAGGPFKPTLRMFEGVICNTTDPTVKKSNTSAAAKALKQALALVIKQNDAKVLSAMTVSICKDVGDFNGSTCATKAKAFLGEDGFNNPDKILAEHKDTANPAIKTAICVGPHKNKAKSFCGTAGVGAGAGAAVPAPRVGVGVR